jgi:hypothetical protein
LASRRRARLQFSWQLASLTLVARRAAQWRGGEFRRAPLDDAAAYGVVARVVCGRFVRIRRAVDATRRLSAALDVPLLQPQGAAAAAAAATRVEPRRRRDQAAGGSLDAGVHALPFAGVHVGRGSWTRCSFVSWLAAAAAAAAASAACCLWLVCFDLLVCVASELRARGRNLSAVSSACRAERERARATERETCRQHNTRTGTTKGQTMERHQTGEACAAGARRSRACGLVRVARIAQSPAATFENQIKNSVVERRFAQARSNQRRPHQHPPIDTSTITSVLAAAAIVGAGGDRDVARMEITPLGHVPSSPHHATPTRARSSPLILSIEGDRRAAGIWTRAIHSCHSGRWAIARGCRVEDSDWLGGIALESITLTRRLRR